MPLSEKDCPVACASPAVTPPESLLWGPLGRWARRMVDVARLPRVAVWRGPVMRMLGFGAILMGVALLGERERDLSRYGAVRAELEPAPVPRGSTEVQATLSDDASDPGSESGVPSATRAATAAVLPGPNLARPGDFPAQLSGLLAQTAPPTAEHPDRKSPEPCEAAAGAESAAKGVTADGLVILNEASLEELMTLRGVGAKRASDILALRQKLGKFRKVSDLLRVRGIGWKSLARLKSQVVLDRPAEPPASPAAPVSPAPAREAQGSSTPRRESVPIGPS